MSRVHTITLPDALARRIRRIRETSPYKLNASAVCARALEAECDRIEADLVRRRALEREASEPHPGGSP